uniref:Uncharacterized protein n=1 Tax=viral metagenome TaxID=1070528 RepID=A0A6C0K3X8_9ZZZZ
METQYLPKEFIPVLLLFSHFTKPNIKAVLLGSAETRQA